MSDSLTQRLIQVTEENHPQALDELLHSKEFHDHRAPGFQIVLKNTWLKCLGEQKWELCGVFLEHRWSEMDIQVCREILNLSPQITQPWFVLLDQKPFCFERGELYDCFLRSIHAQTDPQSLLALIQSPGYQAHRTPDNHLPLPLISHLVRSRHPKAQWSFPEEVEKTLRDEVFKGITGDIVIRVCENITHHELSRKVIATRHYGLTEDRLISSTAMWSLWLPEILSLSQEHLEHLFAAESRWQSAYPTTAPMASHIDFHVVFPEWSDMLACIQKEYLTRKVMPSSMRSSAPMKKL